MFKLLSWNTNITVSSWPLTCHYLETTHVGTEKSCCLSTYPLFYTSPITNSKPSAMFSHPDKFCFEESFISFIFIFIQRLKVPCCIVKRLPTWKTLTTVTHLRNLSSCHSVLTQLYLMSESYPHPGDCQIQDATFCIRYLVHWPNILQFYSCCVFKSLSLLLHILF